MKNKIISIMGMSLCILCFYGCGNASTLNNSTSDSADLTSSAMNESDSLLASESDSVESNAASSYSSIPSGTFSDTGSGKITLYTAGGNSENGNTPVIYAGAEDTLIQLSLGSRDFDGSKLSFIYIDGKFVDKEQLSEYSEVNVNLIEFMLNPGTHKVEVMQFDNDDTSTQPITYKTASYEIKRK